MALKQCGMDGLIIILLLVTIIIEKIIRIINADVQW